MGRKEKKLANEYLRNIDPEKERSFRINAGSGWVGSPKTTIIKKEKDGSTTVIIKNARRLHAAPTGWPDLVGWETIDIALPCCGSCKFLGIRQIDKNYGCTEQKTKTFSVSVLSSCEKYKPRNPIKTAVFTAREIKATGRLSEDQKNLRDTMRNMGVDYDVLTE